VACSTISVPRSIPQLGWNISAGGEVVVSDAVLADDQARAVLNGRRMIADSATMRGLSAPVGFVRIAPAQSDGPALTAKIS